MRKIVVALIAVTLAVALLIVSGIAVARLTLVITNPHVLLWLKIASPVLIVFAALPAVARRIRARGFFNVEF